MSDVFAALEEKRPYKEPFTKEEMLSVLQNMFEQSLLDDDVVGMVACHFQETYDAAREAGLQAKKEYDLFYGISDTDANSLQNAMDASSIQIRA